MACRLAGAKPLSERMLEFKKTHLKMSAKWLILFRPQCVKSGRGSTSYTASLISAYKRTRLTPCMRCRVKSPRYLVDQRGTDWWEATQLRWAKIIISVYPWGHMCIPVISGTVMNDINTYVFIRNISGLWPENSPPKGSITRKMLPFDGHQVH